MATNKNKRIKISGYARRIFFNDNIEYRNFSPDLVGLQLTSKGGTPLFTMGNFSIEVNLEPKTGVFFKQGGQSKVYTLDDIVSNSIELVIQKNLNAGLNLDLTNPLNYIWYGSASELIRASLQNIQENWPAAIYVDNKVGSVTGNNITNYVYDIVTDEATFTINSRYFVNPYEIKYTSDEAITGTEEEDNPLRNFTLNYKSYTIEHNTITKNIKNITPASQVTNSDLDIIVEGNPFPELTGVFIPQNSFMITPFVGSIPFLIKPNELERENFFTTLNDLQQNILNRNSTPEYKNIITSPKITDNGMVITTTNILIFPILDDDYNLNFFDSFYITYLDKLNTVGENYDQNSTDLILRKYTAEVISSFDTVPRGDGDDLTLNGEKATKLLRIYGVEFDEVKKYINGIKFAHVVTYDKKDNIPDSLVKDLAHTLGFQTGNFVSNVDLNKTILPSYGGGQFSGTSTNLSQQQIDIELYRRLILNIAWMWKSKGTRKAIEFLFRFIGAPEALVKFNEYIVIVDKPLDLEKIKQLLYIYTGTVDTSHIPYDENGFPLPPQNGDIVITDFIEGPDLQTGVTPSNLSIVEKVYTEMYFQKAGGWYRETLGSDGLPTILEGNNPHMGPYDGGNEYLNYFSKCFIPNFSGGSAFSTSKKDFAHNIFLNYNYGIFNSIPINSPIYTSEISYNSTKEIYELIDDCIDVNYDIIETPLQNEGKTTLQEEYDKAKIIYDQYVELIKKYSFMQYSPEWQKIKYKYELAKSNYNNEIVTENCSISGNQTLEICITTQVANPLPGDPPKGSLRYTIPTCDEYEVYTDDPYLYFYHPVNWIDKTKPPINENTSLGLLFAECCSNVETGQKNTTHLF